MVKISKISIFVLFLLLLSIPTIAIPPYLDQQGVLRYTANGTLLSGEHNFNLTIYNTSNDVMLYTENKTLTVSNGVWNYIVGYSTGIVPSIFIADTYFQTRINAETLSSKNFTTVPYAFYSLVCNDTSYLNGLPASSYAGNASFNVSTTDDLYVNIVGDTMSGNLSVSDGTYNVNITPTTIISNTAYAPLLQIGAGSVASASYSVAIGLDAEANSTSSIGLGSLARAYGVEGIALGAGTYALYRAAALGYQASASGDYSVAIGNAPSATGDTSIAIGNQVRAIGDYSLAMLNMAIAEGMYSVSIGITTNASGWNSYAFGDNVTVAGIRSYGFGEDGTSTNNNTFTLHNLDLIVDGNITSNFVCNATHCYTVTEFLESGSYDDSWINASQLFNNTWEVGDDYATFDGSTWLFNQSKLETTYYQATSIRVVTGTGQGTIGNLQTYNESGYNISEVDSDFDLRVNFTGVTGLNQLIYRYRSEIGEPHIMHTQVWDYIAGVWEEYAEEGAREHYGIFTYPVFDEAKHLSSGLVQVRFYTTNDPPDNTHKWEFDWVIIADGFGTPSSSESDPFSVHRDGTTPLTGNWNAGNYYITALGFNGSWNGSVNYYTKEELVAINTSQTAYTDARDIIVNDSSNVYADIRDVIYNNSCVVYADVRDIIVNDSSNAYADATDILTNESLIPYIDDADSAQDACDEITGCVEAVYINLTETDVEDYIFDNDNTANLNMSDYNITDVDCIKFATGGMWCGS